MALQIGIVGLPNVGKSTLFNALTQTQQAEVANYPFCTIEPNQAVVPVPDQRLETLAELIEVQKVIHTTIEFLDIAGLVAGASRGEGLGNQFLSNIRNTDALLHVVRCFDDPNVIHVSEHPDPRTDIEIIQMELALSDLEQVERKIDKLIQSGKGQKGIDPHLVMAEQVREHLQTGSTLRTFPEKDQQAFRMLNQELRFLTAKPVIYAANLSEADLGEGNPYLEAVRETAAAQRAEYVKISALLEAELVGLDRQERQEYLSLAGIAESGLKKVIHTGYEMLDLISFFTYNEQEARAWTVRRGSTAPQAAGRIHTDFQRGFIKAEVVPFEEFQDYGSMAAAREAGKLRVEGKEYQVQDGDVIYFRFNV